MSERHDEFFAVFDQGNWFLASQKIVSLADQSTFGAEVLIRLFEGDRFLSNGKFFPGICRDEPGPKWQRRGPKGNTAQHNKAQSHRGPTFVTHISDNAKAFTMQVGIAKPGLAYIDALSPPSL